jgi:hypothetical protein
MAGAQHAPLAGQGQYALGLGVVCLHGTRSMFRLCVNFK